MILFILMIVLLLLCCSFVLTILILRQLLRSQRHVKSIAFFHPECDGLGGGERVLWCIVKTLLMEGAPPSSSTVSQSSSSPSHASNEIHDVVIYSSASSKWTPRECLTKVQERFGIDLLPWLNNDDLNSSSDTNTNNNNNNNKKKLRFIPLYTTQLINPHSYPRFTLMLQSLGSMIVSMEALIHFTPQIFIDTTGYAFTLGVASWLGGCQVSSYIHYPIISTDMIRAVKDRRSKFNNATTVAQSSILSSLKLVYYRLFAWCYGLCGGFMDSCVVNSSWTYSHIADLMTTSPIHHHTNKPPPPAPAALSSSASSSSLFNRFFSSFHFHNTMDHYKHSMMNVHRLPLNKLSVVYPPCDIKAFAESSKPAGSRVCRVVSVAQFRPEKNHQLQLDAMARLLQLYKSKSISIPRDLELVICGSVRNLDDQIILDRLKTRSMELGLGDRVRFEVNLSFNKMKELLGSSKVGLHSMIDEHFGIALVEFLASGLIVVAHNSAGPRMDILNTSPLAALFSDASMMAATTGNQLGINRPQLGSVSRSDDEADDMVMLETPRRTRTTSGEDDCVAASFGYLCQTANGFAEALFQCLSNSEESAAMLKRIPGSLKRFHDNDEFGRKCIGAMDISRFLQQEALKH